jgi:hypothetical protein
MSNVIDNPRPDKSARQPKVKRLAAPKPKVTKLPSGLSKRRRGR